MTKMLRNFKTTIEMVEDFHKAFDQPIVDTPQLPPHEVQDLRLALLQEELNELSDAFLNDDLVAVLDALTDLQYVLDGTYLLCGLKNKKHGAFEEVHYSNMSKLGEDGKPIFREDGKILKGPNYYEPQLDLFVKQKHVD